MCSVPKGAYLVSIHKYRDFSRKGAKIAKLESYHSKWYVIFFLAIFAPLRELLFLDKRIRFVRFAYLDAPLHRPCKALCIDYREKK